MDTNRAWRDGQTKDITFIVTKDCQLACKYCYLVGKNTHERMSWPTAKAAVDFILANEKADEFAKEAVVFNFIGGEPFLEIELIDQVCDYLKAEMRRLGHHWLNAYMISITTNGINYDSPKVQEFILKNYEQLSLTITIDGTRAKHDINRVWKSDPTRGSYDAVVRNIPLWLEQFPWARTKVTVSSADLPYICESVIHLFGLGIHNVAINCVFEDVWHEGDDVILEQQLRQLADAIIDGGYVDDYDCTFFQRSIGMPLDFEKQDHNWCGAGKMLGIDAAGNLYPCTRFSKFSLREKEPRIIGTLRDGLNQDLLRPFDCLSRSLQSSKECIECEVASGCAWCQGENYDSSSTGSIFERSTAICRMHKARVRANEYFWERVDGAKRAESIAKVRDSVDNRSLISADLGRVERLYILLSDASVSFCSYEPKEKSHQLIALEQLERGVAWARSEELEVAFVYPDFQLPEAYYDVINSIEHIDITRAERGNSEAVKVVEGLKHFKENSAGLTDDNLIVRTTLAEFYAEAQGLGRMLSRNANVEIVFADEALFSKKDERPYGYALQRLADELLEKWDCEGGPSVNLVTERLGLEEMGGCDAGWKSVTLAPDGRFYICPAFYYDGTMRMCDAGSLDAGLDIKAPQLFTLNYAPLCRTCGAYQCRRCVYLNRKLTKEVNIPSYRQCRKSELELQATKSFYAKLQEKIKK